LQTDGAGIWSQKTRKFTEPRKAPVTRNRMAMTNTFTTNPDLPVNYHKIPKTGHRLPSISNTPRSNDKFAASASYFNKARFGSVSPNKMN
jgi:hypothetical protein